MLCPCRFVNRTARFCNSGAQGGQITVSWETIEGALQQWQPDRMPVVPSADAAGAQTPVPPQELTCNYLRGLVVKLRASAATWQEEHRLG